MGSNDANNRPHCKVLELTRKQKMFSEEHPFYFTGFYKRVASYNGDYIGTAEGFTKPHRKTKDVIVISVQRKQFLEIRKDKSLWKRDGNRWMDCGYKVNGYSLNPPILILSDGRALKINQNPNEDEEIFQEVPELSPLIPKIDKDEPQYIDFVDGKYAFLKSKSWPGFYTRFSELYPDPANKWKPLCKGMQYIDTDEEGELFVVQRVSKWDVAKRLAVNEDGVRTRNVLKQVSERHCIISFLSSWNSMV